LGRVFNQASLEKLIVAETKRGGNVSELKKALAELKAAKPLEKR
jgi:hypothetical protein